MTNQLNNQPATAPEIETVFKDIQWDLKHRTTTSEFLIAEIEQLHKLSDGENQNITPPAPEVETIFKDIRWDLKHRTTTSEFLIAEIEQLRKLSENGDSLPPAPNETN